MLRRALHPQDGVATTPRRPTTRQTTSKHTAEVSGAVAGICSCHSDTGFLPPLGLSKLLFVIQSSCCNASQVPAAVVAVAAAEPQPAAPSSVSAHRAEAQQLREEVRQLRMQLQERDAKERQLLTEVATLSRYA